MAQCSRHERGMSTKRSFRPAGPLAPGPLPPNPLPPAPYPGSRLPRDRKRGFSMVELIVTLALVTIITGIALPRIDFSRARVGSAAHELVTTLTAAQSRAVLNQHDVVVRFDTTGATAFIHVDTDNDGTLDAGESTRLVALPDGVQFGRGPAPARTLGTAAVSFDQLRGGLPSLTFHRNGSASQAGVIYLIAGAASQRSSSATHVRAIEVARPTGRSVCLRYLGAWEASC
jgi:prepilin-type N-terminal cleavage/methylation domain-containing protein